MIYSAPPDISRPQVELRAPGRRRIASQVVAYKDPAKEARPRFTFRQRYVPIEGGRLLLRLTTPPQLEVDPVTMEFDVVDWGIRLPCEQAEELPATLARRFLELFSKADGQSLSDDDQNSWVKILDRVDYSAFCIDRAAPHYVEGQLVRFDPCFVDWHDGERSRVEGSSVASLRILKPGDRFGAFVKLGRDNIIRSIERLTLLTEA